MRTYIKYFILAAATVIFGLLSFLLLLPLVDGYRTVKYGYWNLQTGVQQGLPDSFIERGIEKAGKLDNKEWLNTTMIYANKSAAGLPGSKESPLPQYWMGAKSKFELYYQVGKVRRRYRRSH